MDPCPPSRRSHGWACLSEMWSPFKLLLVVIMSTCCVVVHFPVHMTCRTCTCCLHRSVDVDVYIYISPLSKGAAQYTYALATGACSSASHPASTMHKLPRAEIVSLLKSLEKSTAIHVCMSKLYPASHGFMYPYLLQKRVPRM